mgnify:CR=1 FL=1
MKREIQVTTDSMQYRDGSVEEYIRELETDDL